MMRRIKKKMIQQQQRLLKSLRFMANNNNQNTNILDRPNHLNDDDDDDYGDHDDFVIPHISLPLYIYCKQYMSSNHEKRIRLVDSPSPSFGIFESSSTSATVAVTNHGDDDDDGNIYNWSINVIEWKHSNHHDEHEHESGCQQSLHFKRIKEKMSRKFNKNPLCELMIRNFWECFQRPFLQLCQQNDQTSLKATFYKECDRQLFLSKLCIHITHNDDDDDHDHDDPVYLLQTNVGIFKITLC
nr:uncharacterized protein LOC124491895 [Dermatophagoides farinae]